MQSIDDVTVTEPAIRAAGGLVLRGDRNGGVDIALVHRRAYDDWEFPKGKLHPGETEPDAALREVEEETGLRCWLGREIGTSSYVDVRGRPKIVRYWEMSPVGGEFGPGHEIDDVRWLALAETRDAFRPYRGAAVPVRG